MSRATIAFTKCNESPSESLKKTNSEGLQKSSRPNKEIEQASPPGLGVVDAFVFVEPCVLLFKPGVVKPSTWLSPEDP